jgi:hypothetical protein
MQLVTSGSEEVIALAIISVAQEEGEKGDIPL